MPASFAHNANARTISEAEERPAVELRVKSPRVLIVGPPSLTLEQAESLKEGMRRLDCSVALYRTTDEFRLTEVVDEMASLYNPFSHLLLVLGHVSGFEDQVLHAAAEAKIPSIALLALHSRDAFERHAVKIREEKFKLLIIRTPAEHVHVRRTWGQKNSLIVEHLETDAARIAELFVGKPARQSIYRGWDLPGMQD